jgi:pyruvate, orthophosphate dikinase
MEIWLFDHDHGTSDPGQLVARLGQPGFDLHDLTVRFELPVPPGFTLSGELCSTYRRDGWTSRLQDAVSESLGRLEDLSGRTMGAEDTPLLVSVRPSPPVEMPGVVPTLLDVGCTAAAMVGLAAQVDERFALDTRLRFVRSYAVLLGDVSDDRFGSKLADARRFADVEHDDGLPTDMLRLLVERFVTLAAAEGTKIPDDPAEQVRAALTAAFDAWDGLPARRLRQRLGRPGDEPLPVSIQMMVFGNAGPQSASGVLWSRDPHSGAAGMGGLLRLRAQGGLMVPGAHAEIDLADLVDRHPQELETLRGWLTRLEAVHHDAVGLDVTVERGHVWVLGRHVGSPHGMAALQVASDLVDEGVIDRAEAVRRVSPGDLEAVLHAQADFSGAVVLATGLAASPGAAVGRVVFSADSAAAQAAEGREVILVKQETSPEDVHGMTVAAGILTTRGGLASHAAVVARGWGKPAVCGAESIELGDGQFTAAGIVVREGDVISIDGGTGIVVLGAVPTSCEERPEAFDAILAWADEIRAGRLGVRANADTASDAVLARDFGAEGIGLCRTEHMFLVEERLPIVRQLILAATPAEERVALARLRMAQRSDFVELLEAMDGLPVTVRLLDPPLHEFLPDLVDLEVRAATGKLGPDERRLLEAARAWHEVNPMIGTRGVRLGWLKPGLYAMQVRALLEAVADRLAAGGAPHVGVMIPLTVSGAELAGACRWVTDAVAESGVDPAIVTVGTMIETPRAVLRAGDLAAHSDFFSFGTNDLSQLTFGFSRDDVEGRLMARYLEEGLLDANPFETIDEAGVGELVGLGVERGRAVRPRLEVGVCGEHGGDPASIAMFCRLGVDYVSCSPFRVPVARLAAAQAVLAQEGPATA